MKNLFASLFRYHRRLVLALVVGVLAGAFIPGQWNGIERPLVGWNIGLWCYLLTLWWMMSRIESTSIRALADREDESALTVLFSVTVATIVSIAAIILELATTKGAAGDAQKGLHILLTSTTLIGGWLLLPTIFTIHYARMYYEQGSDARVFRFPDEKLEPDYWDFAYFSFTIAVASQTSDVAVASPIARRLTMAQSVLSFFFNLAILGLSINIAASMLS